MREVIELEFSSRMDRDGVFDGRELAGALVQEAYRMLLPYVGECPACAETLFGVVADRALAEITGKVMRAGSGYATKTFQDSDMTQEQAAFAFEQHRRETQHETDALMLDGAPAQKAEHNH